MNTIRPGDICIYSFESDADCKNKSVVEVEVIRILPNHPEGAEIKVRNVSVDDSGNGYFHYLQRSGNTMNASIKYLRKI